ncbi:MAG: DUF2147 domain-containing protein [Bacteroidetes bacterium]|nr:DUF2147 domain-containing protein [Bacteroidota bacterium]
MKKSGTIIFALFALFALLGGKTFAQKHKAADVLGFWYNEEKTSKVQIYQEGNKFFAKVVWLKEPNDKNTGKPRTDNLNPDVKLQSVPLLGLVILKNFVFDGDDEWHDGTIYDPKNGKTYSCKMEFSKDSPNLLKIRGYVGVSLLGRTTYWTKTILQ